MNGISSVEFARNIRMETAKMVARAKSSHIGSCFSIADIVAVLYNEVLDVKPDEPFWPDRDRFILSKGHACAVVYAALSERGFFPKAELETYGLDGSRLMAHISHKVPGVDFSTGSLGHGLPFAVGKALAAKLSRRKSRVFAILGDGELDEGSNWEALLFAAHHKLSNLNLIIDVNNLQSLTTTGLTLNLEPLYEKFSSFGAEVSVVDGHSVASLLEEFENKSSSSDGPRVVLARTLKGKGVDFMENKVEWHYKSPSDEELEEVMRQLMSNK